MIQLWSTPPIKDTIAPGEDFSAQETSVPTLNTKPPTPRHARSPQRVRRARDTFAPRHSESASTRTISAEGSPSARHIRAAPQRERVDTYDLRRGFAELETHSHRATARVAVLERHSHGATARARRHVRSPQTVRRARDTFAPRHSQSRRARETLARRHSESASTRTISAEGSPSARHIRAAPQRERVDTYDLRRGFAELETHSHRATARVAVLERHSHGATARALRHAQSPQRVRRAQDTFARRHSESASTRTISAEGSPSSRQVSRVRQLRTKRTFLQNCALAVAPRRSSDLCVAAEFHGQRSIL